MTTRRKSQSESSEIVGGISKLVGSLIGTIVAISKRIASFKISDTVTLRARIAELESELAAVRLELRKVRYEKRDITPKKGAEGQKAKTQQKSAKGKISSRPQSRPTPKTGVKTTVAVKAKKPQSPSGKSKKKVSTAGSAT